MSLKVALCISGHFREYRKTFQSIKTTIIDIFHPDIFISTWDEPGYWTSNNDKGVDNYGRSLDIEDVKEIFNPTNIEVEDLNVFKNLFEDISDMIVSKQENKLRWGRKQNLVGMYYKIWKCNNLKKKYENIFKNKNICQNSQK